MKIAVCVKQVPAATAELDTHSGNLIRRGTGVLNPFDAYALEAALQLKEGCGGELWAITMGPESAETVLRDAVARGADRGVLISDPAFAGADTYATAFTLAQTVCRLGGFDLIVCGRQTTDGDTAQVAAQLAAQLDLPCCLEVSALSPSEDAHLLLTQELSGLSQRVEMPLPGLIALGRESWTPRMPTVRRKILAGRMEPLHISAADFPEAQAACFGQRGSRTAVTRTWRVSHNHAADLRKLSPEESASEILQLLEART